MSDIFISYASEDRQKAKMLAEVLPQQGWSVFWDRDLAPGDKFREVISKELNEARCIIALWSTTSISKDWVLDEANEGLKRNILVPVLIEKITPPLGFGQLHMADLSVWFTKADDSEFANLLNALAVKLEAGSVKLNRLHSPSNTINAIKRPQESLTNGGWGIRPLASGFILVSSLTFLLAAVPFLLVRKDIINAGWLSNIPYLVVILWTVSILIGLWKKSKGSF